ncbi:MAG: sulfoxide reductase heme-binding subunit YedZ, partial [Polaromonas sp.]|nr:sulfoxide reductase heme-binding subunit YedZ [Polaromonas sp.]
LLHFFWMRSGKNDFAEVAIYAAILAVLLGWRVRQYMKKKRLQPKPAMGKQLSNQ